MWSITNETPARFRQWYRLSTIGRAFIKVRIFNPHAFLPFFHVKPRGHGVACGDVGGAELPSAGGIIQSGGEREGYFCFPAEQVARVVLDQMTGRVEQLDTHAMQAGWSVFAGLNRDVERGRRADRNLGHPRFHRHRLHFVGEQRENLRIARQQFGLDRFRMAEPSLPERRKARPTRAGGWSRPAARRLRHGGLA